MEFFLEIIFANYFKERKKEYRNEGKSCAQKKLLDVIRSFEKNMANCNLTINIKNGWKHF